MNPGFTCIHDQFKLAPKEISHRERKKTSNNGKPVRKAISFFNSGMRKEAIEK